MPLRMDLMITQQEAYNPVPSYANDRASYLVLSLKSF